MSGLEYEAILVWIFVSSSVREIEGDCEDDRVTVFVRPET